MAEITRSRPQWRTTPWAAYGLLGIAVSAFVHFETYFGLSIDLNQPLFFALHIAVFPLFFVAMLRAQRWWGKSSWFASRGQSHLRELWSFFPGWVIPVGLALFAYTALNFFFSFQHLPEHTFTPTGETARYVVRLFSGHWLLFYTVPTIYLGYVPKDARPRQAIAQV